MKHPVEPQLRHLHLSSTSAPPQLDLSATSAPPQLHLSSTSAPPQLHLSFTSDPPQLHLSTAISTSSLYGGTHVVVGILYIKRATQSHLISVPCSVLVSYSYWRRAYGLIPELNKSARILTEISPKVLKRKHAVCYQSPT
jgi:hypothetical protein